MMEVCEVDVRVRRFVENPICLFYEDGQGRVRRHIPDLFIDETDGGRFVEIKWECDARHPKNESRWPHIGQTLAALGFPYEVLTERHILAEPRATNVRDLLRDRRTSRPTTDDVNALRAALEGGGFSIGDAIDMLPSVSLSALRRLIADGEICVDLNVRLSTASPLFLPPHDRGGQ